MRQLVKVWTPNAQGRYAPSHDLACNVGFETAGATTTLCTGSAGGLRVGDRISASHFGTWEVTAISISGDYLTADLKRLP